MGNGNYLLIDDGPWYYSIMGESAVANTTPALLPAGSAGSISIVGGENLVMLGTSDHKDAAWTFMQYMSSLDAQILMAQAGMIPTLAAAANDEDALAAPYIAAYFEQLASTNPRTPNPNWAQIDEKISLAFESVFREEKTATEALNEIAGQIDGLLTVPE
jgi:multiple sugar transport system substrate-binding protein